MTSLALTFGRSRFNGLRVDVGAVDRIGAELGGGDGENARAAAVVEHVHAGLDVGVQPLQAQMRGRVRAGAEGNARIKADVDRLGRGRFVPGGHDPEPVADAGGFELRLRHLDPVFRWARALSDSICGTSMPSALAAIAADVTASKSSATSNAQARAAPGKRLGSRPGSP